MAQSLAADAARRSAQINAQVDTCVDLFQQLRSAPRGMRSQLYDSIEALTGFTQGEAGLFLKRFQRENDEGALRECLTRRLKERLNS